MSHQANLESALSMGMTDETMIPCRNGFVIRMSQTRRMGHHWHYFANGDLCGSYLTLEDAQAGKSYPRDQELKVITGRGLAWAVRHIISGPEKFGETREEKTARVLNQACSLGI